MKIIEYAYVSYIYYLVIWGKKYKKL